MAASPHAEEGARFPADAQQERQVHVRRALLAINPRKRSTPGLSDAISLLKSGGVVVRILDLATDRKGAARMLSEARDADAIVVGGGDGTLHYAAPQLIKSGLPVAVLPLGTANDFARTLRIPADPVAAARVLLDGKLKTIDLGQANGVPYFNVATIGMSVEVARSMTRERKQRWGSLAYAVSAARQILGAERFDARIETSGEAFTTRTLQIAVGNGRFYGGGTTVDERAAIDDGHLHIYSLELPSVWSMLPMLWSFRHGTHVRWSQVRTRSAGALRIKSARSMPVSADGEICTSTPCSFRVLPEHLNVFVPR